MVSGILRFRGALSAGLAALLLSVVCGPALRAASFELPPLNTPASTEHHVGKVIWVELVTPDLAAAERFYGGLFGWTFRTLRTGDSAYAVALADGRPVGGLFQKPHTGRRASAVRLAYLHFGSRCRRRQARRAGARSQADIRFQKLSGAGTAGRAHRSGRCRIRDPRLEQRRFAGFPRGARGMDLEFIAVARCRSRCCVLSTGFFLRRFRPRG